MVLARDAADSPKRRLVVVSQASFASYELPERGAIVLGRSQSCDLTIDDPSVTRRHAVLRIGDGLEIEDLGSVNGTRVRDRRLEPGRAVPVFSGESIYVGTALIIVQDAPLASARANAPRSEDVATHRAEDAAGEPRVTAAGRGPASPHVVSDPAMRELYALVDRLAVGTINVLVVGETGVGKELVAGRLHERSPRRARPFLRLNCAALAEALLESELFGHERGAFTGAHAAKPGLLETADGGTVFLDEVGELPLAVQAKLLRALEEGQVMRIGGLAPRAIDVRFVAATNRSLEDETRAGRFRRDLFFRLNAATIAVPPLRARRGEIAPLAHAFVDTACRALHRPHLALGADAVALLERYTWPGNVRELKNAVERAVLVADGPELLPVHFPIGEMSANLPLQPLGDARAPDATPAALPTLAPPPAEGDPERERILRVLRECAGNQSRAAKALGISRSTLVARLDAYRVPRPRKT